MPGKVCYLASGGMDSSFGIHLLKQEGYEVLPCYLDYGQAVKACELNTLQRFLSSIGLKWPLLLEIKMFDIFTDFWAVSGDSVPSYKEDIANEYIPARNILFIVKTAAYMQLHNIQHMAVGCTASDCMPDNRRSFFDAMEAVLALGMESSKYPFVPKILTPTEHMTKTEIAKGFAAAGLDATLTWSCYGHGEEHCGECWQCYERHEAFVKAGIADPTKYAKAIDLENKSLI